MNDQREPLLFKLVDMTEDELDDGIVTIDEEFTSVSYSCMKILLLMKP